MEQPAIQFENRILSLAREAGYEKLPGALSPAIVKTLACNPSAESDGEVIQLVALCDEKAVGGEISFANRYIADGKVLSCRGASTLFVEEAYRKYDIAVDIMVGAANLTPKQDNIVAGISQQAFPLYKAMRYACFSFSRLIYLKKSRVAIEYLFKRRNSLTNALSIVGDVVLSCHRGLAFIGNRLRTSKYSIEKVREVPKEVEDIVIKDKHRFKELHDCAWFEWCLNHSFNSDSRNDKYLCVVKNSAGEIEGFFVNKIEFYEKASSRGFKNVLLGTVSEWGVKEGSALNEYDIQVLAMRAMPKNVDGVEVATTESAVRRKLLAHLFMPMGEANMAVLIQSFKDKAVKDINNWRVRIAAGDTLLN